jgi:hypothetical protein
VDGHPRAGSGQSPPYWFPAKRYGWGWGPPVTWQGWLVTAAWFLILLAGVLLLDPHRHPIAILAFVLLMSLLLLAICYAKGERPRWRWGE